MALVLRKVNILDSTTLSERAGWVTGPLGDEPAPGGSVRISQRFPASFRLFYVLWLLSLPFRDPVGSWVQDSGWTNQKNLLFLVVHGDGLPDGM